MLKKLAIIASFPFFMAAVRFIPFDRLPNTCMFFHLTGYPCPSCGMTRAITYLARLDFARAIQMNPLGLVVVAAFGLWWVISIYQIATGRRTRAAEWARRKFNLLAIAGLVILLLFGAVRIMLLASR